MADVKWIKLSTGTFESRKIKQFERMPDGDTILVIWFKLLCLAGQINDEGRIYLTPDMPYDDESLAIELNKPADQVAAALTLFTKFGMLHREKKTNHLTLTNWEKYQNVDKLNDMRAYNREAQRRSRERKRQTDVNDMSMTCQPCQGTEEEKEEDRDKEIDKEEENHLLLLGEREEFKMNYLGGTLGQGKVLLSDEQFDSLCNTLSKDELTHYCNVIAEQLDKGRKYSKSHYQAIMDMAAADRRV